MGIIRAGYDIFTKRQMITSKHQEALNGTKTGSIVEDMGSGRAIQHPGVYPRKGDLALAKFKASMPDLFCYAMA